MCIGSHVSIRAVSTPQNEIKIASPRFWRKIRQFTRVFGEAENRFSVLEIFFLKRDFESSKLPPAQLLKIPPLL